MYMLWIKHISFHFSNFKLQLSSMAVPITKRIHMLAIILLFANCYIYKMFKGTIIHQMNKNYEKVLLQD
jgi:hypothetical protein